MHFLSTLFLRVFPPLFFLSLLLFIYLFIYFIATHSICNNEDQRRSGTLLKCSQCLSLSLSLSLSLISLSLSLSLSHSTSRFYLKNPASLYLSYIPAIPHELSPCSSAQYSVNGSRNEKSISRWKRLAVLHTWNESVLYLYASKEVIYVILANSIQFRY